MCVNLVSMDVKLLTNIHTIYDDYIGSRRNLGQRYIYSSNYKKYDFAFFVRMALISAISLNT